MSAGLLLGEKRETCCLLMARIMTWLDFFSVKTLIINDHDMGTVRPPGGSSNLQPSGFD